MSTKKLNLPIIKKSLPEGKQLSMDNYLSFVYFYLKYTFDREAYEQRKSLLVVRQPFFLKD